MPSKRRNNPLVSAGGSIVWTDDKIELLGSCSDQALAQRLGVSKLVIYKKRRQFGIPPCRQHSVVWTVWNEENEKLLGVLTDKEVAEKVGVTRQAAQIRRNMLGIKPKREHAK